MGFDDVDNEECYSVAVLVVELVKGGNLPPEWRSSVAAEDEHHGLFRCERRELDRGGLVELIEGEVRGGITGLQMSGARMRPHRFEWSHEEHCVREMLHDAAEGFGRLMHGPPDESDERDVENCQEDCGAEKVLRHDGWE